VIVVGRFVTSGINARSASSTFGRLVMTTGVGAST
jgi:hypothetical protein